MASMAAAMPLIYSRFYWDRGGVQNASDKPGLRDSKTIPFSNLHASIVVLLQLLATLEVNQEVCCAHLYVPQHSFGFKYFYRRANQAKYCTLAPSGTNLKKEIPSTQSPILITSALHRKWPD